MPEISIVLPVYNGEKYLNGAIESVINQTFKDWELIIVNDCSNDSSKNIAEKYVKQDKRIKLINNLQNQKLPQSLNIGFREAQGKYYTWTSDDNIYEPEALLTMYETIESDSGIPMVVADMMAINEAGEQLYEWPGYQKNKMIYNNAVGACFLYKSEVEQLIGGYDSNWFLLEDYDYWIRILDNFGEIVRIPQILYKYRLHRDSLSEIKKAEIKKSLHQFRKKYLEFFLSIWEEPKDYIYLFYEMQLVEDLSIDEWNIFKKMCPLIASKASFNENSKLVIYGAGLYGEKVSEMIPGIKYFVDKDDSKIGRYINDIEVISIERYKKIKNNYTIVIAISEANMESVLKDFQLHNIDSYLLYTEVLHINNCEVFII